MNARELYNCLLPWLQEEGEHLGLHPAGQRELLRRVRRGLREAEMACSAMPVGFEKAALMIRWAGCEVDGWSAAGVQQCFEFQGSIQ